MKRQITIFVCAWLILVSTTCIKNPYRVVAQTHGNVIIGGQVLYQPRYWNGSNWGVGKEIRVELYEKDTIGIDYLLDTSYTDSNGVFTFPSRTNWWPDDNRQLNVYIKIVTVYPQTAVTDRLFRNYAFSNSPTFLSHDGTWNIDFYLSSTWSDFQALWIFEDIRKAWNYVHTYYGQYDPGSVTAVWEQNLNCYPITLPDYTNNCNSFTYAGLVPPHFIFITSNDNTQSMDVVIHETAHMYMVNADNWWYVNSSCFNHDVFGSINTSCAWSEGWADFFPLPVNNNHCYNRSTIRPCYGVVDVQFFDLEAHSRADGDPSFSRGDTVEGRVATSLYDLYDSNNEGWDRINAGFFPIANISLGGS